MNNVDWGSLSHHFISPLDSEAVCLVMFAVMILIVLDLLFGMLNAIIQHDWQSIKVRQGLGHKCSEMGFIIVAWLVDVLLIAGINLPFEIPNGCAMMTVCIALVIMELSSLMEIFVKINPKLEENPLFQILESVKFIKPEDDKEPKDE